MTNRLAAEASPYLRQHAENPVDWYPWGDEAFERARREDRPVFLSVGYSACHWCHVMAHESFEDAGIAAILNEHFVSVKVDREERPDVDAVYMDAVVALTGHGGWPMSVFLTPDGRPFFGGTYFPPVPRHGMPGFAEVLRSIASLWDTEREQVLNASETLTARVRAAAQLPDGGQAEARGQAEAGGQAEARGQLHADGATLASAERVLLATFDPVHGGWGRAPRFPQPAVTEFVLRRFVATGDDRLLGMATRTLDAMMRGGVYDQLGGGFHRYSVDDGWLVPHFEKMLYDNAQLARLYLHAWQVTGDVAYRSIATGTLDYLVREMRDPSGGFYSAQDADTEGEEGRYFVWTPEEVRDALAEGGTAEDAALIARVFGITAEGNFEGRTVLSLVMTPGEIAAAEGAPESEVRERLDRARAALLAARERRVRPGLDDKVLAGWNGLALAAFAEAARVLGRDDYRAVAEQTARFLLQRMRDESGRMHRVWSGGAARLGGYLEDHAACAAGLLELYRTTFEPRWFEAARELADVVIAHFGDPAGGFFDTSDNHETLVVRPKTTQDGAVPSGGSLAAAVLVELESYTGEAAYGRHAAAAVAPLQGLAGRAPHGFSQWLAALDALLGPKATLAIVGPQAQPLLDVVWRRYRPDLTVAAGDAGTGAGTPQLLKQHLGDRSAADTATVAYLCRGFVCERPVSAPEDLARLLDR